MEQADTQSHGEPSDKGNPQGNGVDKNKSEREGADCHERPSDDGQGAPTPRVVHARLAERTHGPGE